MIRENIGRRSILKGIGAAMGNPLRLFQKAAVATANELAANVVEIDDEDERRITKCTVDMIPGIMQSYIHGVYKLPIERGVLLHKDGGEEAYEGVPSSIFLDVNDVGATIAQYFKNDFSELIGNTIGGEGLYGMDEAFGGVFSKLFTNAANYMGHQNLAKEILEIYGYDAEMALAGLQDVGNFSNLMAKIFNPSDLEKLRDNPNIGHLKSYFKRRGVDFKTIDHSPQRNDDQSKKDKTDDQSTKTKANDMSANDMSANDMSANDMSDDDMSDDDWMATTHGGYEPGRSGGYSKDRVFESKNIHCFTNSYRQLIKEVL